METWKPVVGYEGLYEVSDLGNVRSLNWHNEKYARNLWLKPHNKGYFQVELVRNKEKKMHMVHRLVAIAFIPNPLNLPQVNHKDENKKNNAVENLEWCDNRYNVKYSMIRHPDRAANRIYTNSKRGTTYKRKLSMPIYQCGLDGEIIRKWENSREIFVKTGMSDWSISECCRGKRNKAYGFKWRYATDHSDREAAL